jgi:hypothetical protein
MLLSPNSILDLPPEAASRRPRKPLRVKIRKPRRRMRIRASELKTVKVRPRIQRAFFAWLIRNRKRLSFDLLIEGRTDTVVEFSFVGVNRAIAAVLTRDGITVSAEWEGDCWDFLMDQDSYPEHGPTGYFCSLCLHYFRETHPGEAFTRIFPSQEAVWADDIFEPFLEWVNDDLAKATYLVLFGTPDYGTWAKLLDAPPEGEAAERVAALLPCRLE